MKVFTNARVKSWSKDGTERLLHTFECLGNLWLYSMVRLLYHHSL